MKLGKLIKHDEMMGHAKEPKLLLAYIWSNFPLIIFHTMSCPLYNSKTIRDISVKLDTRIKHNERMRYVQEITLAYVFLLFPFFYFPMFTFLLQSP